MDVDRALQAIQEAQRYFVGMFQRAPEDKLQWTPDCPEGTPTSMVQIARHLISADTEFACIMAGEETPADIAGASIEESFNAGRAKDVSDRAELVRLIETTMEALEDAMGDMVELPWATMPRAALPGLLAGHWSYHCGQVAYIQRCYGDVQM